MATTKIDLSAGMIPKKPSHPSGEVTAWDEKTLLPIVRRREAGQASMQQPADKPAKPEPAEDPKPKPAEKPKLQPATLQKGQPVILGDGSRGKVAHLVQNMSSVRVRTDDGRNITVGRATLKPADHVVVKTHVRRLPGTVE